MNKMNEFPKITSNNLILDRITYLDIPCIVEYAGNIKVSETTLNIPHPYEEKDAIFWINNANNGFDAKTEFTFGVRTKISNEFVGGIGLKINNKFNRAVLGYWIAEPYWNMGYATEAVRAILKFGFEELYLNKIFGTCLVENRASGKVMIKNGMIKEGELKDQTKKQNTYRSVIQYRLTKEEFEKEK